MLSAMPAKRVQCRKCERPTSEVGSLSRKGLCRNCAVNAVVSQGVAIRTKSGPEYLQWVEVQVMHWLGEYMIALAKDGEGTRGVALMAHYLDQFKRMI